MKITNTGKQIISTRIGHLIEPPELRDYLDLVDCGFILPLRLHPARKKSSSRPIYCAARCPTSAPAQRHLRSERVTAGICQTMKIASLLWSAAATILLVLPPYYLLSAPNNGGQSGTVRTIKNYLKSAYAHDHKKAYRLISNRDRQIKSEDLYIQEKGPFSGFTLTVAGKLAELIEVRQTGARKTTLQPRSNSTSSCPTPTVYRHCYSIGTKTNSTPCRNRNKKRFSPPSTICAAPAN